MKDQNRLAGPLSMLLLLLAIVLRPVLAAPPVQKQYDIVVYGATSAGVIAAYTAKMHGKSVLLVDPGMHLGGLTTGGLGYTDIGNKYAITGLSRDFYRRIGSHYGKLEQWTFEPKVAKQYLQEYLDQADVSVMYGMELVGVTKPNTTIASVMLKGRKSPFETVEVAAKVFIDCTYEGDLMALADVSYRVGREANAEFNETINGVQLLDGHQLPDGIDPYVVPGKPSSGLIWGIQPGTLAAQGSGDKLVQAYNFRICLTNNPDNRVEITRPEGYDPQQFELLVRLMAKQPHKTKLTDYFIWSAMPNQKTDINNRNGFSTDMIGMNYDYPNANWKERERIVQDHVNYTKGLLYFFGHDERVPESLRAEMRQWGYPKDEYTDTGNWSPQLYIREARRMHGAYVMTQANCVGESVVPDGVGMAAYTMDSHNTQRIVVNGMVKNEGNVEVGGFGPYPISYRSLVPKRSECDNLLVPVCLSATHIAFGSIRMEPVFMVLAQSAATAAAMVIDGKSAVQDVDVEALQRSLKQNPLANGSVAEILVDNNDDQRVEIQGAWVKRSRGGYGTDFLEKDPNDKAAGSVRYTPAIAQKGRYSAYLYLPHVQQMAPEINVSVQQRKKISKLKIRKADMVVVGQTSGEWYHLGDYNLSDDADFSVTILAPGGDAGGVVSADAMLFIPN
ncbi:FAD dependent oxidoreductase [Dyadobacter jejuensis]|uniref:FAD dependent oxidoreductase n=1 Tax=Dyadobacter jejuensis TaxID=1082580 RepID=A0A316AP94_9BACT|nr:FAD-dependent oxidoreductase [Dyadobacter jejuensis]PWJ59392.1 FAD dependent oxidoreductase [Dyadobacter jejuensis]